MNKTQRIIHNAQSVINTINSNQKIMQSMQIETVRLNKLDCENVISHLKAIIQLAEEK